MNFSAADTACLAAHKGNIEYCISITRWNPGGITSLANLTVDYLATLIPYNATCNNTDSRGASEADACTDAVCATVSNFLPLTEMGRLDDMLADPAKLDVGLGDLLGLARTMFPYPLNESSAGEVADWWQRETSRDGNATVAFVDTIARECWWSYCRSEHVEVGNQDVVGIGMLISVVILMVLSIIFSLLAFGTIRHSLRGASPKKHWHFRTSILGTLDDLFRAVLVFALSVIISCFVFRYNTASRFDSVMADTLSMVCSTTVVILCAAYWSDAIQPRVYVMFAMFVIVVLTVVLFGTHFYVAKKLGEPVERYCGRGSGYLREDGRWDDLSDRKYVSVAFACWCIATIGAIFHHPRFKELRPKTHGLRHALWVAAAGLATIAGVLSLGFYSWYFWKTFSVMMMVYGRAFTNTIFKWGFGQYLALATWAAPILHFFHLWLGSGTKEMTIATFPSMEKVLVAKDRDLELNAAPVLETPEQKPSMQVSESQRDLPVTPQP